MFSLCQNYGCGESSIDTHTHEPQHSLGSAQVLTNTHIRRCHLFLSITVKNQTLIHLLVLFLATNAVLLCTHTNMSIKFW